MKRLFQGSPSRFAVLTAFFINGAVMATWVSRIPFIQNKLSLSEGTLGLILFGLSAGVMAALSMAGGLISRYGSLKITFVGAMSMCLTLPLLALIPNPIVMGIALFVFGGAMSIMDVSMNDQAVHVERNSQRPLMSSFHAAFSFGGLFGALLGSGMAAVPSLTPFVHFLIASVFFGVVMVFTSPHLLPIKHGNQENKVLFRLPEKALWVLGSIAFFSAIAEGTMADWSAVYLTQVLKTNTAFAALGFAAFSLTMTIGRLMGDSLAAVWKPGFIVRFGGFVAALGLLLAVISTAPIVTLIGFSFVGIGLANIIPLTFSSAGNMPDIPSGAGIAGVATIGYAGFLAGPPIIGFIAEASSLRVAFFSIMILVGTLIFSGKAVSSNK